MSDGVKRCCLSHDEDVAFTFRGSIDEWPGTADVGSNCGTRQRTFLENHEIALNPSSSPFDAIGDSQQVPAQNDNEEQTSSTSLINVPEKPINKPTSVHASNRRGANKFYALRDSGPWKPSDDLLLIISVLQVNDLDIVCSAAKFSCKFTFAEVQTRWNALLYDDLVSRASQNAIRKMHPEQQEAVHRRAPFSLAEEDLLCDIPSTESPNPEDFHQLLDKHSATFYHARTPKSLQKHWRLLRQYELLCDQRANLKYCAAGEIPASFSETEAEVTLDSLKDFPFHGHVDEEIKLVDQQMKRKTRLLEDELGHWMQLLGTSSRSMDLNPKFDSKTFGILRGQRLHYAMRTRFISFGRLTSHGEDVDVDLTVEGPVYKVSRYQGGIELRSNGTFATCNFGKRPFYVDGRPVFPKKMVTLRNNSVFEIFDITFVFLINKELVEDVCFNELDTD